MTLRSLIPPFLSEYVRLVLCRHRYPGRLIDSPHIHSSVVLGRSCRVAQGCELWAGVTVGDYSYFSRGSIMASGSVGKYCSIAPYTQIGMPAHPTDFPSTSPFCYGSFGPAGRDASSDELAAPPTIGHDVWIGSNAVVLQGVTIGHGAVIGAGSVVTRSVPPYMIVAGVPARPLRRRFTDSTCNELLAMQWWDLPPGDLEAHMEYFAAPLCEHMNGPQNGQLHPIVTR